jgi:beta-N-acetylhexosaminidase
MIGFEGEMPSEKTLAFIRQHQIGGVILFSRNIQSPAQCVRLTDTLRKCAPDLLIAIDQEGGRVLRLGPPFTPFPAARQIGACDDPAISYQCAAAMAAEMAAVGINMDFSPVLDVDSNPQNPVIGDRAFGTTPEAVSRHARAMIAGLQDQGIIACGKHFPGHGDTASDSHHTLPSVVHPPERLHAVEIPPFVDAIRAGVASIMTAHVLYPAWDARWPASLSPTIVTDLLRKQMGFDGVVITDDLEMKGITERERVADAAVLALQAGSDMALICHSEVAQQAALEALIHAAESSEIPHLQESLARVRNLKERFLSQPRRPAPPLEVIGCPAHQALIQKVMEVGFEGNSGVL